MGAWAPRLEKTSQAMTDEMGQKETQRGTRHPASGGRLGGDGCPKRLRVRALTDEAASDHLLDAILDVGHQRLLSGAPIARKSAFEQHPMFAGRGLASVNSRYHLIAQIAVENHGMRVEQNLRATRG